MGEGEGPTAPGQAAGSDSGVLIWVVFAGAILITLVVKPWAVLGAVLLGGAGAAWYLLKEGKGVARKAVPEQTDGDLGLPPARPKPTLAVAGARAAGAKVTPETLTAPETLPSGPAAAAKKADNDLAVPAGPVAPGHKKSSVVHIIEPPADYTPPPHHSPPAAAAAGAPIHSILHSSKPPTPPAPAAAVPAPEPAAAAATAAAATGLTGSAAILAQLRSQRAKSSSQPSSRPASASSPSAAAAAAPPKVTFLYASQTGTGQEIARSLHAEACAKGLPAAVMSFNELGLANLTRAKTPVVVIVASSTGDGDPPDNAGVAYVALKKNSQPKDLLAGIHYTVLGLGDSNYTRFMAVPRGFKNRFAELGGTCFYPCIEADEVDGLEDVVDPWLEGLWGPLSGLLQQLAAGEEPAAAAAGAGVGAGVAAAAAVAAAGAGKGDWGLDRSNTNSSLQSAEAALMHEPSEANGLLGGGGLVAMELSETGSGATGGQLSGGASLLGDEASASSLPDATAPAATATSAASLPPPAEAAPLGPPAPPSSRPTSAVALVGGLAPEGVELSGVPALAPCRVELDTNLPSEVVARVRAKERQRPNPEQAVHRDEEGQYSADKPFWAPVVDARLLTAPESDRRVISVTLSIEDSGMSYHPGDAVGVLPLNDPPLVEGLLTRLGVEGSSVFQPQPAQGDPSSSNACLLSHLPWPCSVHHALSACIDLTTPPRKSLLRVLAEYCSDAAEQRTLLFLCSKAGKEAYAQEITAGAPSLLDLLNRFPSCKPPLGHLLDVLQPLPPRMYSLTTSPLEHPTTVEFAFSTVTFPTRYGTRKGVATHWLERLLRPWLEAQGSGVAPQAQVLVPLYLRPAGHFRPPRDLSAPLLMIGPGTGVAPFRGFLQQRRQEMKASPTTFPGPSWLYFGCRRPEEDYLFKQDWQEFLEEGALLQLRTAFSRAGSTKQYVQHLMLEDAAALAQLISSGGYVYVCGDGAGMAKDVHAALVEVLVKEGGVEGPDAAAAQLAAMAKEGRYVRDIWS